jgi:5'-nucleotidase
VTDSCSSPGLSRRSLLAGAGGLATAFAIGSPAYASDAAREPSAQEYVDVQLLNITDFHGNLLTPTSAADGFIPDPAGGTGTINVGGAAYLATHLKRLRKPQNSIFFSVGDDWCGAQPLAGKLVRDEGSVEVLNNLGVQFSTLGNHELDYGVDYLVDHMIGGRPSGVVGRDSTFLDSTGRPYHGIEFPYYSANMVSKRTNRPFLQPYNIEWVHGANGRSYPIGFIHLTLDGTPVGSSSYEPKLVGYEQIATANRYAAFLKRRGINALVISIHDGAQQVDNWHAPINGGNMSTGPALLLAAKVDPDICAIITGHWHWWFNAMLPDPNGMLRPVVEASHAGQMINEVNLKLDPHTGKVIRDLTVSTNHPVTLDVTPDPEIKRIVDYWTDFADARYSLPAGRTTADITRTMNANGSCSMGDLAADFLYWDANTAASGRVDFGLIAAKPSTGSVALRGDFTFAKGDNPADADGVILYGEAYAYFGYENPVLTVTLTGAQIHQALEQQWQPQTGGAVKFAPFNLSANVSAAYDATKPVGARVDPARFLIDGRPLDLQKSYRVAGLAYTLIGADGYPALAAFTDPVRNDRDHEGFIKYLRAMGTISPSALDRITIKQ